MSYIYAKKMVGYSSKECITQSDDSKTGTRELSKSEAKEGIARADLAR